MLVWCLNSQKLLQTLKVARGCSKGKKLLKTPKVAHKLPSTIYKGLASSLSRNCAVASSPPAHVLPPSFPPPADTRYHSATFLALPTCHPTSQAATHHPVMTLVVRFVPSSPKLKTLWSAQFPSMTFSLALLLFPSPLVLHGYKPNKNVPTYAVPTLISSRVPVHQSSPPILRMSSAISMLPLCLETV